MEVVGEGAAERNQIPPFLKALDIAPGATETSEAGEACFEEEAACELEFPQAARKNRISAQEAAASRALTTDFFFVSIFPN